MIISRTVKILLLVGTIALLNPISNAQEWIHNGPFGVFVYTLAIDPIDTNIVYCGTRGRGIWKSVDSGETWFEINNGIPMREDTTFSEEWQWGDYETIFNTIISPYVNGKVWISIRNEGSYTSDNAGANWYKINGGLPDNNYIYDMVFDPTDSLIIFAGLQDGLYKSSDGGESWDIVNSMEHSIYTSHIVIKYSPNNSDHIYAQMVDSRIGPNFPPIDYPAFLYKSTDSGENWEEISEVKLSHLEFNIDNPDSMWGRSFISTRPSHSYLMFSSDGGRNWERHQDIDGWIKNIYQDSEGNIYVQEDADIWKSDNNGHTWSIITTDIQHDQEYRGRVHIAANPDRPNSIYFGNDQGLYHSDDGGINSSLSCSGIDDVTIYKIEPHPSDPRVAYALGETGIWKTENRGENWDKLREGYFRSCAIDQAHPDTLYAGGQKLLRSFDGGVSWDDIGFGFLGTITAFAIHPTNSNILYCSLKEFGAFFLRSTDYGETWEYMDFIEPQYTSGIMWEMVVGINHEDEIYVGLKGLFRSRDAGLTWRLISDIGHVSTFIIDPDGQDIYAYCAVGYEQTRNLYKSENGGNTFREFRGDMNVRILPSLSFHPDDSEYLVVASENGLHTTNNNGLTWSEWWGPHSERCNEVNFSSDGETIYLGTKSFGIWSRSNVTKVHNHSSSIDVSNYNKYTVYPNPFNSTINIRLFNTKNTSVNISIFNVLGMKVKILDKSISSDGVSLYHWDGLDEYHNSVANGIYFIDIFTRNEHRISKIIYCK
ncbi:MAG: T9SS type A sorting domain-containing protein [Candidatus Electryonea clarkiae]|nr:T9SS type A sorting domain-containing protein [Candidatus Electryonea clarkiae]